jgi:hypothetical protein
MSLRHHRICFHIPARHFAVVRQLADAEGVSTATITDRIIAAVVAGGKADARRKLAMLDAPHPEPQPTTGPTTTAPARS